jgi:MFS family permease
MSLWFSASAVAPQLASRWDLSPGQTGWLTAAVQLGFVAGTATAAVLNLADIVPSRVYFAASALLASLANAALLLAPGFAAALLPRFLTGFFLAGVYPPAMKMIATWYKDGRGLAIGTVVGALTVGKAMPYLARGVMGVGPGSGSGVAPVVLAVSAAAAAAAVLVAALYRDGPYPFDRRPFSWGLVGSVARHRGVRLATSGYLGHMWELYAMWTWIAAFFAATLPSGADHAAFAAIAAGGLGCVWGGWAADRIGRERVTVWSMAASGSCALVIGTLTGAPALALAVALVWGFFVVADSAQFSTLVTELAPAHAVGTALTIQTSLGFLLTMVTIQLVPVLVNLVGWGWAFTALTAGPWLGIAAMRRLMALRAAGVV